MAVPQISSLPDAPSRQDDGPAFIEKADAFLGALDGFGQQANAQADFVDERVQAALDAGLEDAEANATAAQSSKNAAATSASQASQAAAEAQEYGAASEAVQDLGNISGAVEIDLNDGTYIVATLVGDTTFSFTNLPSSGVARGITMELTEGGSPAASITWPGTVQWGGGSAPTITEGGTDLFVLVSVGSSRFIGARAVEDLS